MMSIGAISTLWHHYQRFLVGVSPAVRLPPPTRPRAGLCIWRKPARASSSGHVLPAFRRSSPAAAASWSAPSEAGSQKKQPFL